MLKELSQGKELEKRNIHHLHENKALKEYFTICKECGTAKLYSADIVGRKSNYRLLFCKSAKERVYKILHICTSETHNG